MVGVGVCVFGVWSRRRVFAAEWESDFGIVLSSMVLAVVVVHLHKMGSDIRPMGERFGAEVEVGVPLSGDGDDVLVQYTMVWFCSVDTFRFNYW